MNAEQETRTALPGRAWQPIKPVQFPRNSSFVIICASQVEAYSAGQEELPEYLRSKNDSTLLPRASSRKFTQISPAENQPPSLGSHKAAAPASSPPHGHPQKEWKPQGNTSGPAQRVEVAPWKSEGKEISSCQRGFAGHGPWGREEAVGSRSPRASWREKDRSLMVNVSPSWAKSTSFHGVKVKCGSTQLHTAPRGSENAASAQALRPLLWAYENYCALSALLCWKPLTIPCWGLRKRSGRESFTGWIIPRQIVSLLYMAASHGQTARGLSEIVLGAFPSLLFIPRHPFLTWNVIAYSPTGEGLRGHKHSNSPRGPSKGTAQGPCVNLSRLSNSCPTLRTGSRTPTSHSQTFAGLAARCQDLASPAELLSGHARPLLWHAADHACRLGVHTPTASTCALGLLDANQEPQNCFCREHQRRVS